MAEEIAGRLFIELLPDVDKKKFQAAIDKSVKGTSATIPTTLKLTKTAVSDVVTEAQTKLSARKKIPVLAVGLKLDNAAITALIAETQANLSARKKRPVLTIDVKTDMKGARGAGIVQATKKQEKSVTEVVRQATATRIANIVADYKKIEEVGALHRKNVAEGIVAQYQQIDAVEQLAMRKRIANIRADHKMIEELSELHAMKLAGKINTEYELRAQVAAIKQRNEIAKIAAHHEMKDQLAEINAARQASILKMQYENLDLITAIGEAEMTMKILTQNKLREQIAETGAAKRTAILLAEAQNTPALVARTQALQEGRLNALMAAGLDQRSLMEARHQNQLAAIRERGGNRARKSSRETLRILRNDLSQFDSSTTRLVRRGTFLFAGLTAAVTASFAAIAVGALRSFAQTEVQIRRTAAVLGTEAFTQAAARGEDAYAAFGRKIDEVNGQLQETVNLAALRTVFDPTETARGARALAQAGAQVDDIKASLLDIARFAQNEEILPEEAVQQLVQGATAAGMSISEINSLADRFTFVANNTTASAKEIAEAFANRAAPAFRAYGQSIDQTLTVLNLFAAAGIKGKTAGEQAGILIREINKAATKTPKTIAAFQKYGIQVGRVNGKNIEFTTTLSQLAAQFEKVRAERGSQGLALLRKELGLTEKSGAGLIQILPQITDLQLSGLQNLTGQIASSRDAVTRQAEVLTKTLSFQVEQFGNQVSALFKTAAGPLAKGLTQIFLGLNGEIEGTVGITDRLNSAFQRTGERLAKTLLPSLRRFAFGGEGEAFIVGLKNLYAGTLKGLRNSFIEFRRAAFGDADGRGFFSVLGDTFAALGRFSERALPRLGQLLGDIVGFIRENRIAVNAFVKSWIGLYLASKALRLFILPLVAVGDNMKSLVKFTKIFIGLNFAQSISSAIPLLASYSAQIRSAASATKALAAAQAGVAALGAAGAAGGTATAAAGAAAISATRLQRAGKLAGNALLAGMLLPFKSPKLLFGGILKALVSFKSFGSVFAKIIPNIAKFAKFAGPFALIGLAIEAALGAIKGFFSEIKRSASGNSEFAKTLKDIQPVIDIIVSGLKTTGKIALDVIGIVFRLGEALGKFLAGAVRQVVINFGDVIRIFTELAQGNWVNAFKALGDVILNTLLAPFKLLFAFILDALSAIIASGRNIPGIGKYFDSWATSLEKTGAKLRDWNVNLSKTEVSAKRASKALGGVAFEASKAQPVIYDAARGVFTLNRNLNYNSRSARVWSSSFIESMDNVRAQTAVDAQGINNEIFGITSNLERAGRELRLQMVSDAAAAKSYQDTFRRVYAGEDIDPAKALERASLAGAAARQIALGLMPAADAVKKTVKQAKKSVDEVFKDTSGASAFSDAVSGASESAADSVKEVKTAAEQATEAVNKLSQAQLNKQAGALVAKVTRAAAKGYQATAVEAEILRRTLPAVEAQLQRQQDAVAKLDKALQDLQSTQLKGTKAFSDQAFAIDQNVKKLQLQRLDLVIAGAIEEDAAIVALDEQIAKLQQQSERLSLVESLKLDPLRRKLEETFNPVKELTFDEIIKQFNAIQKQRAPLTDAIAGGENLKATLETAIKDAEARFGDAGRQVTAGFAVGIKGATPQVTQAGKTAGNAALAGVNNVMKFGSPSRTMIQRGLWVSEGFVQGINAGSSMITSAGVTAMFSFLTGMRNVYENRIQPFIKGIAKWIKENKGPVSYDATLLRPAGEAMMQGFHRGLRDGFNEVKTWVSDVGPDLARHTIPDKIFKKMSAEFLISNASADMAFDPGEFFASITPMGEVGVGANFLGQSLGLDDTIKQAQMIARMFGITPNISSARRRFGDPAYNAAIGGAANSLHIAGRAMDFTGSDAGLTNAADWARKYMEMVFQEVLWKTTGHYDHLHLGWKYGNKKLIADIAGASRVVEEALANAANLTKVDFNLLAAIAKAESGFNPNVVSSAGAGGLMQLMPGTARSLGVTNVFDPKQNALGGAKYIKQMLENFNGNTRIALAAYNAGPGNAMIAMRQFSETIAYIEKVMRYFNQFKSGNYRAQGGKVNSMTPYIVGERGQELFVPSQNGSVISNKDLRDLIGALNGTQPGAAAGTTINDNRRFEVISNSTDPATVAALVDARMRSQIVGVRR